MGSDLGRKGFNRCIVTLAKVAPRDRLKLQIAFQNPCRFQILHGRHQEPFAPAAARQGYRPRGTRVAHPVDLSIGANKVAGRAIDDEAHRCGVLNLRLATDDGYQVTLPGTTVPFDDRCHQRVGETPAKVSVKGGWHRCQVTPGMRPSNVIASK